LVPSAECSKKAEKKTGDGRKRQLFSGVGRGGGGQDAAKNRTKKERQGCVQKQTPEA